MTRVVVITGGFGTLGRAAAELAAQEGHQIVLVDRSQAPDNLPEAVLALGGVDCADPDAVEGVAQRIQRTLGRVDTLLNIAGTFRWETVANGQIDTWDLLYRVNVRTAVTVSRGLLTLLRRSDAGRIVNVGAMGAIAPKTGFAAYAASKSGVARLTESLACELKSEDITVNAVLPSIIDTEPNRKDMPDAPHDTWVKPHDLARVMLFLGSDAATAVTGALVPVRGRV